MSNIRYGALIKNPPPLLLKRSSVHFDIVSDSTADGSQNREGSAEFAARMLVHFGAQKRFVATAGLSIGSNLVGIPQMNYQVSPGPVQGEFGQINDPFPPPNIGAQGQVFTERPIECAYVFPFNRWNMVGHGTLVPSTEISAYPATNTYLQQRSKVWRSTTTTASLTRNLGNPYRMSGICIVSHNLTRDGTFRVQIGNDSTFGTTKYDSGTLRIWEPAFATSGLYEEEADIEGYPTDELIELLRYCGENPRVVRWVTFGEINAQHIKIDFTDVANPHGLIEVAYIYAGLHIKVKPDQVYGWNLIPIGVSRIKKSASGSPWIDVMYRSMNASANFASQPEPQTLAFWSLISGYLGKKKEFIIAFQPDNLPRKQWFTLYGRFKQTPQIENIAMKTYNVPMEIEELVG